MSDDYLSTGGTLGGFLTPEDLERQQDIARLAAAPNGVLRPRTVAELADVAFLANERLKALETLNTPADFEDRRKAFIDLAVAREAANRAQAALNAAINQTPRQGRRFTMSDAQIPDDGPDWWVVSTAIGNRVLMLENRTTGEDGVVDDPTDSEWSRAFFAPSTPYKWNGDAARIRPRLQTVRQDSSASPSSGPTER